ncbi:MAG: polysaccharide deacetylase family protein [Anaerolineae bacterium]|nr:polysaccharide deacetylase family protein [Anaerolineae bacterium]
MKEKPIFLTFDGAPNPPATDRLLAALDRHQIKATFFMEGKRLEEEADCARRVAAAGHDIGNHSYNHPLFDLIPLDECIREVEMTQETIYKELGFYPTLLRPPAGKLTEEVKETFLAMGFDIVLWSVWAFDWHGPDPESIAERILYQIEPGAIIPCHDRVKWLSATLDIIVPAIKAEGYSFRRISESSKKGVLTLA